MSSPSIPIPIPTPTTATNGRCLLHGSLRRYAPLNSHSLRMRIELPAALVSASVAGRTDFGGRRETRMRIGLMIGPEKGRYRHKVAQLVADAAAAERDGFTSIWTPQI